MAVNAEILDRIHQYLLGEMPEEMVQAFEKDLQKHPEWSEAMEVEQELISIIRSNNRLANKARIEKISQKRKHKVRRTRLLIMAPVLAAASLLIIILLNFQSPEFSLEFPSDLIVDQMLGMPEANPEKARIKDWYQLYQAGKYSSVLEQVTADSSSESLLNRKNYLLGASYFQLADYESAIRSFDNVLQSPPSEGKLRQYARWGIVLCHYSQKEWETVQSDLNAYSAQDVEDLDSTLRGQWRKMKLEVDETLGK